MVTPTDTIRATVDAPAVVEIPAKGDTVEIAVRAELTNTTGDTTVVLHAPSGEHQAFWHVLDENHREVQRQRAAGAEGPPAGCEDFRSLSVQPGHPSHHTDVLTLAVKKLKAGKSYTVRGEIFGQVAEARFITVEAPAEVAKAAKKEAKAAKKKAKAASKKSKKSK